MLFLFPSLFWGYFAIAVGGALGFLLPRIFSEQPILWQHQLLCLVWIFGWVIVFTLLAKKREARFLTQLNNCQVAPFIALYEQTLTRPLRQKQQTLCLLNLSCGYLTVGNVQGALAILYRVRLDFGTRPFGLLCQGLYYNNLCDAYLQLGDVARAKQSLDYLKITIDHPGWGVTDRSALLRSYQANQAELAAYNGDYVQAEAVFLSLLQSGYTPLHQVSQCHNLAKLYLAQGQRDKAEEHLQFAAAYGGDTYYAAWARQILNTPVST